MQADMTAKNLGFVIKPDRRAFLFGGLVVLSCLNGGADVAVAQATRLSVVATTGMIADAARQVGGDRVDVRALMGPGVDPHEHRMTQSDIATTTRAELVLWHGLNLEAQMEPFLKELSRRKRVVAVAESLAKGRLLEDADNKGKFDPHVWMDPALWSGVVESVKQAMIAARPDATSVFEANAKRHLKELEVLEAYAKRVLITVPQPTRTLITAHDAFGYFGRAFAFRVVGIQGLSTESEAGLNKIREIVEMTVKEKVPAIFVESSVSNRNIEAVIEGARAKGHGLRLGGELFSDALGDSDTYEGTYVGMIDHNVTLIARALGGDAPARGMQGRLAAPRT